MFEVCFALGQYRVNALPCRLAKTKDEARNICWNAEGKFDDTNGLAIRSADKSKYGSTLSEFATYLSTHPNTVIFSSPGASRV